MSPECEKDNKNLGQNQPSLQKKYTLRKQSNPLCEFHATIQTISPPREYFGREKRAMMQILRNNNLTWQQ